MSDTTPTVPSPARRKTILDFARWVSDLHCLWRYCERRGCQRARACSGDARHCLHFMPLVPIEVREFILNWDAAKAAGLSFEEMMKEHAEEWATLTRWQEMVRESLPENRPAQNPAQA